MSEHHTSRRQSAARPIGARWLVGAAPLLLALLVPVAPAAARIVTASGTLSPVATVMVGSNVSGVVAEVTCDFNTQVTKGQTCARIDPRPFQKEVEQARANLANATATLEQLEASLTYLKGSFERNSVLVQRGVVSKDQFESISSNYAQARAQIAVQRAVIAQRKAELEGAELNLGYTSIVSPIDGIVLSRRVAVGETVAASFQSPTLFVIASDLARLQLVAQVPESEIGTLRAGDTATFTVRAYQGRTFNGRVLQVRNQPESAGGDVRYGVVLDVENGDHALRPGMTATVRITTADR